jgi:hypothetical protein
MSEDARCIEVCYV